MLGKVGAGPLPRMCPSPQGCKAILGQLRVCLSPQAESQKGRAFPVGLPETPSSPAPGLGVPWPWVGGGGCCRRLAPPAPKLQGATCRPPEDVQCWGLNIQRSDRLPRAPPVSAQRSLGTGAVGAVVGLGSPGSSGRGGDSAGWVVGPGSPGRPPRATTHLAPAGLLEAVGW